MGTYIYGYSNSKFGSNFNFFETILFIFSNFGQLKFVVFKFRYPKRRRNISICIALDLSIPTEMTSIEPLVENEKIIEDAKEIENCYCLYFLTDRT